MKNILLIIISTLVACDTSHHHTPVCHYENWRIVSIDTPTIEQKRRGFDIAVYKVQNLANFYEESEVFPTQFERTYKLGDTIKPCK